MKVDPAATPRDDAENGGVIVYLSTGGGLTQFGAYLDTLMPGGVSSQRHWHESEDEFLYVLEGAATVIDDDGAHDLGPGDAACWRHGDPNAHHLTNKSDMPCTYLIVGTRVAGDICHYPDEGESQVNLDSAWQIVDAAGKVVDGGDLPPELLNLPPIWGDPFDPGHSMPRILRAADSVWQRDQNPVHPITGPGPGPYSARLISDLGGLSQFGAFVEELPPGSSSGHRHWHEAEDEMVYLLSGEVVLVEDTETPLRAGDAACWPAGQPVGHRLDNRSDASASYLVIGTRADRDIIHYTDHDLITHKDGSARRYLRRDGSEHLVRRTP
jgi:uncharacterized cupin superfamily protein